MGAADDGRLELDDLGAVIDHASALAPSAAEEVLEGNDAPTWGERLEARGVTPWFRRHRIALASGAVAIVALGALGSAWSRSQPPPVDPTIRASVGDALSAGLVTQVPGTTYDGFSAVALQVEPRAGEAIAVLGISGPGIRASHAVPDTGASAPGVQDVFMVPGCDDPRSAAATFDDYRLQVRRTDAYSRVTVGSLTLPSTIAAQLADGTNQSCFQTLLAEAVTVTDVVVTTDVRRRTVAAAVTLTSTLGQDVLVQGVSSAVSVLDPSAGTGDLTAGSSITLPVTLTLDDCTPPPDVITRPGGLGGGQGTQPDLSFYVSPVSGGSAGATIPLSWSPGVRTRIAAATRAMCAGSPGATARVVSASPAPVAVSRAFGFNSPSDGVVLRMRVELASSGSQVTLTDGALPYGAKVDVTSSVTTATADTRNGPRVVSVDWAAQCSGASSPPDIWLTATARGREFPYRSVLDQAVLARAYSSACPGTVPADLSGFGWATG